MADETASGTKDIASGSKDIASNTPTLAKEIAAGIKVVTTEPAVGMNTTADQDVDKACKDD